MKTEIHNFLKTSLVPDIPETDIHLNTLPSTLPAMFVLFYRQNFSPQRSILGLTGRVEEKWKIEVWAQTDTPAEALADKIQRLFEFNSTDFSGYKVYSSKVEKISELHNVSPNEGQTLYHKYEVEILITRERQKT